MLKHYPVTGLVKILPAFHGSSTIPAEYKDTLPPAPPEQTNPVKRKEVAARRT